MYVFYNSRPLAQHSIMYRMLDKEPTLVEKVFFIIFRLCLLYHASAYILQIVVQVCLLNLLYFLKIFIRKIDAVRVWRVNLTQIYFSLRTVWITTMISFVYYGPVFASICLHDMSHSMGRINNIRTNKNYFKSTVSITKYLYCGLDNCMNQTFNLRKN